MQYRNYQRLFTPYLFAIGAGIALWSIGYYFTAALVLLTSAGVALAQPCMRESDKGVRQLALNGSPVLLMLCIMFVAASGMTGAVNQVAGFFGADAQECKIEIASRRVIAIN